MTLFLIVAAVAVATGGIVGAFTMAITVSGSDRRHAGTLDLAPAAARGELVSFAGAVDDTDGGWDWPVAPRPRT